MNAQSVANSLSSLVKILNNLRIEKKQEHVHVFEKLCERAMIISNEMKTQNVSNILWAMAKFQWDADLQIRKIVKQAVKLNREDFKPQAVSNILWSMAVLKYNNIKDIRHFVEMSKMCLQEMKGQEVSNLMWALQQLRYYDQQLILQVEDNYNNQNCNNNNCIIIYNQNIVFTSQGISNIMLAFTDLGLQNNQKILQILVPKFLSNDIFNQQDWCNFLYALAVLDCPLNLSQKVFEEMLAYYNYSQKNKNFQNIQLSQIQLAQVFYSIQGKQLLLPTDLKQECKKVLQVQKREQSIQQNEFVENVFPILKSHFEFAIKYVLIYDDQIKLDISLYKDNKNKIAINTWPTKSYFINYPEKLLGRCQHQVFLLEQLGWQVVQISAFKWDKKQYQQQIVDDIKTKII